MTTKQESACVWSWGLDRVTSGGPFQPKLLCYPTTVSQQANRVARGALIWLTEAVVSGAAAR